MPEKVICDHPERFDAIFHVHDHQCFGDTVRCITCDCTPDIEDDAEVSDDVEVSGDEEEEDESNVSGLLDDEVRGVRSQE